MSSPGLEKLSVLDEKGSRQYIYPADVKGFFTTFKHVIYFALIFIYLILPWVPIHGHPAILFDIAHRQFFIFGKMFNAQDFYLVFFLLTGAAFVLILLSTVFGRVWCGFACPQTVFVDGIFRKIERLIEGDRIQRQRLMRAPWTAQKILRKLLKHVLFILVALILAHAFLSYFYAHQEIVQMIKEGPSSHMRPFMWAMVLTGLIYFDCFWFREQFCIVMCPYGRLQSALQDKDTFHVAYDALRGEPRGKAFQNEVGDCVDCGRCVAVCPTGIDIRNGMQLECIGCASCIDACDTIMHKLSRKKGLIRYDSLNGLSGNTRRLLRPRVYAYGVAGIIGAMAVFFAFNSYRSFEANLLRTKGAPYVVTADGFYNQAVLHLVNKSSEPCDLHIRYEPTSANVVLVQKQVHLEAGESYQLPLVVVVKKQENPPLSKVVLVIENQAAEETITRSLKVLGPKE